MDERKRRRKRRVEMNGTSESVARNPKWIRPVSVMAAALIMALVVIPTASMAIHRPGHYNQSKGDDNFQRAFTTVIVVGAAGAAVDALTNRRKKGKGQGQGQGAGQNN